MKLRIALAILLLVNSLAAQTPAYLRASGPAGFQIVSPGCTNAIPTACTVSTAAGLSVGDVLGIFGVCATDGLNNYSAANGIRKIGAIVGNVISLLTLSNANVAANGPWCLGDGGLGQGGGAQYGGKLTAYTAAVGVRSYFDGDNGPLTREFALGTYNGLVGFSVTANVATVGTSFVHTAKAGDKISVRGSGVSLLNHDTTDYTVLASPPPTANTYAFATSGVPDGNYLTQNLHCGAGVIPNGTIQGTENCLRISQRAVQANVAWQRVQFFLAPPFTQASTYKMYYDGGQQVSTSATNLWYVQSLGFMADPSRADLLAINQYALNNIERMGGSNFGVNEAANDGGNYQLAAYAGPQMGDYAIIWCLGKAYLTPTLFQKFLDKSISDITDPSPCTKNLYFRTSIGGGNFATITLSGTTMTGSGTTWNTPGPGQLFPGDYLFALDSWTVFIDTGAVGSLVVSVNSDTSLTVVNNPGTLANGTPAIAWMIHAWAPGSCGALWTQNYWTGSPGSQPATYPLRGGASIYNPDGSISVGANNGMTMEESMIRFLLAILDDDPRAQTDLARYQSYAADYLVPYAMSYITGLGPDGANYSIARTTVDSARIAWDLSHNITGLPSFDTAGPWISAVQIFKMFIGHPDAPFYNGAHHPFSAFFGSANTGTTQDDGVSVAGLLMDHGMAFNPSALTSQYLNYWLASRSINTYTGYGTGEGAVKLDPRIGSVDYKTQPTQYLFQATSNATALARTGWNHPATWRGDAVVSRTGWSSPSDTFVMFRASTFFGNSDHDIPQPGRIEIYKAGPLFTNDVLAPGDGVDMAGTFADSVVSLGATNTLRNGYGNSDGPAVSNITRWAGVSHGAYGDPTSCYAYAMADSAGAYTTSMTRLQKHFVHLGKCSGHGEEIIVTFTDVASPSAIILADHQGYPQNSETVAGQGANVIYDEGTTSYPGTGGCSSLNTNRTVLEQQSGLTANSDPPHVYNLITKFFSPGTITLNCDGHSFAGANGHMERVSIYGGGTVGGTATTLESVAVHKIATQPDTTLTATALNPDANWTGVQTADKVVLFTRGGVTRSSVSFTTTHSGTADYLLAGLTAGTYLVLNGSTPVATIPVLSGDTSAFFRTTAGTISLNMVFPANQVGGKITIGGRLTGH